MSDNGSPYDVMPCPDCGSREMLQHISQSEDVTVDEHGGPLTIEPRGAVDVLEVWCKECDEKKWSKD